MYVKWLKVNTRAKEYTRSLELKIMIRMNRACSNYKSDCSMLQLHKHCAALQVSVVPNSL